jgi:hypothetical protein
MYSKVTYEVIDKDSWKVFNSDGVHVGKVVRNGKEFVAIYLDGKVWDDGVLASKRSRVNAARSLCFFHRGVMDHEAIVRIASKPRSN